MRSTLLLALAALSCLPAAAQYAEIGITGGYSRFRDGGEIGSIGQFGGFQETYQLGNGIRIGARMSFDYRGYFAHEIAYNWQRSKYRVVTDDPSNASSGVSEASSNIHNYYYNFVAHATHRGSVVRPFVTGGGGMSSFVPPGYSALSRGQTKFGYNYGGGIKFKLSDRYGIRFDVRDHVTGKPFYQEPGRLHNVETSATFSFLF
ncbi:MAG: outer membrane beta-barrel protein [Acidobacteria bacterium]|nr:outer membrane beta-barrel protein [Acidobacteriota bacterium]